MPAYLRKLPNKNRWQVRDTKGHVHAKSTTKAKAEAQVRLLNAVSHGFKPTGKKRK